MCALAAKLPSHSQKAVQAEAVVKRDAPVPRSSFATYNDWCNRCPRAFVTILYLDEPLGFALAGGTVEAGTADAHSVVMPHTSKKGVEESREVKVHSLVREFYEIRKSQEIPVVVKGPPLRRRPIVAVAAIMLCAAAWIMPPLLARGSAASDGESLERNARLSIYLASLTIKAQQAQNGRVPQTARDARLDDTSISYTRLSDSTFELSKPAGKLTISYRSTSDISLFLRSDSLLARKY